MIKPDLVIVQWSAIGRAYSHNETDFIGRLLKEKMLYNLHLIWRIYISR